MHPMSAPRIIGVILEGNIEKYSIPTERSHWSVLRAYAIKKNIPPQRNDLVGPFYAPT